MVMDLESGSSVLETVEDNEGITCPSEELVKADENKVKTNGNYVVDGNEVVVGVIGKSSASSPSPSPGGTKKGYGLKKWRRIRRDVINEGASNVDNSKLMKRGLPNSGANLNRSMHFSGGKQNSQGSVSSKNAMVRSPGNVVDPFAAIGGLGTGVNSENSEDRSSKSSTAASAPKMRYEMPVVKGFASDKNRIRNLSGKTLGNTGQRGQPGKVRSESSKKFRGEVVKIEKENSHSSMESDSRSSNFFFVQGMNSATSNGRQSVTSKNDEGENGDEAQGSDRQPCEELQGGSSWKNGGEFDDNSQEDLAAASSWGIKENENNGPSSDQDPLVESIFTLQSAQEALEKEIQKFKEIGKEQSIPDDSVQHGSIEQLQFDDEKTFDSSESEVISIKQSVNLLGKKLDDTTTLLKVKEAKIVELQDSIIGSRSPRVNTGFAGELLQENYKDIEIELEGLFRKKIEAEVEYLAISRTVQKLRVAVVDQISILEEQKTEQARMLNKLGDAEVKAAMLKEEAEKLENYCEDTASADENIKLKTRIYTYTSCFLMQLMLLLVILTLFIWQLSPHFSEVVPT